MKGKKTVFLYGFHPVAHAWLNPKRRCHRLIASENGAVKFQKTLAQGMGLPRPQPTIKPREFLDRLSKGQTHQGLILEVEPLDGCDFKVFFRQPRENYRDVIILDQVTDPHNVGAILRSAAVFDCLAVIAPRRHAAEVTDIVGKSASGALEYVPLLEAPNLSYALERLHKLGYWSLGLDENASTALDEVLFPPLTALVFGAEGKGLRRLTTQRCSQLAFIPSKGKIKTLNVSNTVALTLYQRQRSLSRSSPSNL